MFPVTRRRFTAFVIFQGAEHRRFWRIFTRRGWRHCLIVLPVYYPEDNLGADVFSIVIDPLTWGVRADVIFDHPRNLARDALDRGATAVVKYRIDQKFDRDYVPRGLFTCVTLLKAILGISAWYVWTPEHLARWLLRNGGELLGSSDVSSFRRIEAKAGSGDDRGSTPAGSGAIAARAGRENRTRRASTADGGSR